MKSANGILGAILTVLAATSCRQPPIEHVVTTTSSELAPSPPAEEKRPHRMTRTDRWPGGCEMLVDVEAPDTLRVVQGTEGLVLYVNEQVGLAVVDVSNPDEPKILGLSQILGRPVGVFEARGAAILVYEPWDRPATTIVRAVAIEPRTAGRPLGEVALAGTPRDARRVGDFVVVTRETAAGKTAVQSFTVGDAGLLQRDALELTGGGAVAGASPRGIAVARTAPPEVGRDRTSITWVALDPELGALSVQGTATVAGVVPRWRSSQHVIDVTEDDKVRLVTCANDACASNGPAAYAAVDFSLAGDPRITSRSLVARAGDGVIGFQGTRLVVARPSADRSDSTELAFFRTEEPLAPDGTVRLRGTVGSIAVRDSGDIVTVGWTGSVSAGKRAIIHHIDGRGVPRLVGAASFGGDWTWTRAYDDERIIGFDPLTMLAALPMTTVRGKGGPATVAQVLSLEPSGPRAVLEEPLPHGADRLLFVGGRLLAFSADGVVVVRREGEQGAEHHWGELRAPGR